MRGKLRDRMQWQVMPRMWIALGSDYNSGLPSADLYRREKMLLRLQVDGENLSNRMQVIDFGGLFSGNAIGPVRSFMARLAATF